MNEVGSSMSNLGDSMGILISLALVHVFVGCCGNILIMETINGLVYKYANIFITFLQTSSVVAISYLACLFILPDEKKRRDSGRLDLLSSSMSGFVSTKPSFILVRLWHRLVANLKLAKSRLDSHYSVPHSLAKDKLQLAAFYNFWTAFFANLAIDLGVEFHYQIIVRSGSVLANIPIGYFYFGKTYSKPEVLCAIMVSIGISVYYYEPSYGVLDCVGQGSNCTTQAAAANTSSTSVTATFLEAYVLPTMKPQLTKLYATCEAILPSLLHPVLNALTKSTTWGFISLLFSIYFGCLLGNYQSQLNEGVTPAQARTILARSKDDSQSSVSVLRIKPHWALLLFHIHLETLKRFIYLTPWIVYTGYYFMKGAYTNLIAGPNVTNALDGAKTFATLMVGNSLTQYACLAGVYQLSYNGFNPLSLSLVLNFRKFLSAAYSFYLSGNTLTIYKVIGGSLVVFFSFAYSFCPRPKKA